MWGGAVPGQSGNASSEYFSPGKVQGTVPFATPGEKYPRKLEAFPGTKLDVPRLAAPRGPARGRARANLRDLSTVCLCYILGLIAGLSPLSLRFVGLRGDLMISDVLANADW